MFLLAVVLTGFFIEVRSAEEILFENQLSGVIQSPNYPETYPNDINITWTIRVREGYQVEIFFTEFDLEDSYDADLGGACVYDYVKIQDGHAGDRKFCGSVRRNHYDTPHINRRIRSTGNTMVVQMISDYSNEDPIPIGFKAHFKEIDRDECMELRHKVATTFEDWDELLYCNHYCHNIPGSYYCSCRAGFNLHENKHTCASDCSAKVLTDHTGEITSSDYPLQYSKLANCDWTIKLRKGMLVHLRFVETFSIERHDDEGCVYDWLQYEYGRGNQSEKLCGNQLPYGGEWTATESNIVTVKFQSDLSVEQSGFKLEYNSTRVKCLYKPRSPSNGQIISGQKTQYEFEDTVTYQCDAGYNLKGRSTIRCSNNGQWNAKEPICEIKSCGPPVHLLSIPNGRIKEDIYNETYGSEVTFLCYVWYQMVSGTSKWICNADAVWSESSIPVSVNDNGNAPKCEPICGLKGNEQILADNYDFGDVIPDNDDDDALDDQIFGGKDSKLGEWPWVVLIDLYGAGLQTSKDFCGGSLVSNNVVVTAAHCTTNAPVTEHIIVYVGMTNRFDDTDNMQIFGVTEVIQHEAYQNGTEFNNDIAVLKLNASVIIGKYARPICLPRSEREIRLPDLALNGSASEFQRTGMITGWGVADEGRLPRVLKKARIPPIGRAECIENVDFPAEFQIKITENMICAGRLDGTRDSCKGDSGGPYMYKDKAQKRWFLNGIVSFGSSTRKCGQQNFGIYTNVAKFMPWLEKFLVD